MTETLVPGANRAVPHTRLLVEILLEPAQVAGIEVDVSAFLLTPEGKVRGDGDMVFYGQPSSGDGCVTLIESDLGRARFSVDLPQVPAAIEKVAFSATIHENRSTFAGFRALRLEVRDGQGQPILRADLPTDDKVETALIIAQLYLRGQQWKLRCIGQGFAGGLRPLAEYFGVEVAAGPGGASRPDADRASAARTSQASETPATPAPTPLPGGAPVSLSKITLDKKRPRVSLDKKPSGFGAIKINLDWNRHQPPKPGGGLLGGLLGGRRRGVDLDLGCLFEMQDGTANAVQALGNSFGSYRTFPYIELKGDDRTGAVSGGEWLYINGEHWDEIRRVLVYAFIYEGVPNWARTDAVVTIHVPGEVPVEVPLTEGSSHMGMCAIALLSNRQGALQVDREVRYFGGHAAMDAAYRWGLQWQVGSKD